MLRRFDWLVVAGLWWMQAIRPFVEYLVQFY